MSGKNQLYFGDNLEVLRAKVSDESVDLVYLDPPFNSNATYNVLFKESSGHNSRAQIKAFDDTWHWQSGETELQFQEVVTNGPRPLAGLFQSLLGFLGQSDMMAYLTMMSLRLIELHRVIKESGTLYLHCDPTASHYLKIVLDSIFGPKQFLNEIIWKRTSAHNDSSICGRCHDVILVYAKCRGKVKFNKQFQPYDESYISSHYRYRADNGRQYRTDNLTASGLSGGGYEYEWNGVFKKWRLPIDSMRRLHANGRIHYTRNGVAEFIRFLDEMPGVPVQDVWSDIPPVNSQARERLGYPTQKPVALLERILKLSSNEGDLLLDPFCGCGTAVSAAEQLGRQWIGIDVTHLAINLIIHRLENTHGSRLRPYEIHGDPKDVASAKSLAERDRYQFQWWALGKVAARPWNGKRKGSDGGIDGYINFFDDNSGKAKKVIIQVKSGHVNVSQIRDLRGVLEREKAEMGVYISLHEPTKPMLTEASTAGTYFSNNMHRPVPKIQILTIKDILDGRGIKYPHYPAIAIPTALFN